jgi:phage terminase large subunit
MNSSLIIKGYAPHVGQVAFHYAMEVYNYVLLLAGIRGGKTYCGARQALKDAWNSSAKGAYLIVAPTYNMLDKTTWPEFIEASRDYIFKENKVDKIIKLKNGNIVYGYSAENPDRIRNTTATGFWGDEAREWKDFKGMWRILLGRALSTGGKGFITTTPNGLGGIYDVFFKEKRQDFGVVRFDTYKNEYILKERIDDLYNYYDEQFARQEIGAEFISFKGGVYHAFCKKNVVDHIYEDISRPLILCCDFNVNPMAWVICQREKGQDGRDVIHVIDEIFLNNSNTYEACVEVKSRYQTVGRTVYLYGDATGRARHAASNLSNWAIVKQELSGSYLVDRVPINNPSEIDRVNCLNTMLCNSAGVRRIFVSSKCKNLINDLERVQYRHGTCYIDKSFDKMLTHLTDALGYMVDRDYSLIRSKIDSLKI